MNENDIGKLVINACLKVHSALGPGLLESIYEMKDGIKRMVNGLQ